ncbi:carbohydrate binding family 9 domain-containing protein [Reichenbachiella versicolor]|uniref:carbohydrate binding family 9 domain-containing protein n=1 Tax=Reichenbachiella versicolor TaxID=1821036 RepID=UPI000D6E3397|nr:carbohydrate binding family 9 domain-containing protein [Reichenbachiella versicolor]
MKRLIVFLFLHLSALYSIAQYSTPPSVKIYDDKIKVDGVLDESIWSKIEPIKDFYNYYPINDGMAVNDSEVKIFHDGTRLNIAVVYHDTTSQTNVSSLKRDDYFTGFHLSDCFGIIIDPFNNQNRGYFFALNAGNNQLDGTIGNYEDLNTNWDAIWYGQSSVIGTDKIYELSIPLRYLNFNPEVDEWSFQFYNRDTKNRLYTTWTKFPRGFLQFDTRFLSKIKIEDLKQTPSARSTVIASTTGAYEKDVITGSEDFSIIPSLDVQYNVNQGLRLDATINPDFSQVDVDQQVTNLSRFNIIFPERRNFFIENGDLFANLGTSSDIIPFYSRFIGAQGDILFGLKLSGNASPSTRVGIMNVQSKRLDSVNAPQNYSVLVGRQQLSKLFAATAYLVNRQESSSSDINHDYNRVLGTNLQFLSENKKWTGLVNLGRSFSNEYNDQSNMYSIESFYNTREVTFSNKINHVENNYVTDIGFVPRLYNYDVATDQTIRHAYTHISNNLDLVHFSNSSKIDSYRFLRAKSDLYLNESGEFSEWNLRLNNTLWFKNVSAISLDVFSDMTELRYAFDPLGNGNSVSPGLYKYNSVRLSFDSDFTQRHFYTASVQQGSFYNGNRSRYVSSVGYRFLPLASFEVEYEHNRLDMNELGSKSFHLIKFISEIFITNDINWTTYIQYNNQFDLFNINSRLQWQYRPLSYFYLVLSDNYGDDFSHHNWNISAKLNYRLSW